jgi:UDP:flavonoid glycosyltransferase YjiC (YdhE family)
MLRLPLRLISERDRLPAGYSDANLLITNGGYSTVNLAISHGIPIISAGLTEDKEEVSAHVQ